MGQTQQLRHLALATTTTTTTTTTTMGFFGLFGKKKATNGTGEPPVLTDETIAIVKSTAPAMNEHAYKISETMYQNMFAEMPEIRKLFTPEDQKAQPGQTQKKQPLNLARAIQAYATHIDDLDKLTSAVDSITKRHVSVGILPEHYPIVGHYLIGAVKEVLGDAATADIVSAWTQAYEFLAHLFIKTEAGLYAKQ